MKAYINGSRMVFVHRIDKRLRRKQQTFLYPSALVRNEGHSVDVDHELLAIDETPNGIGRAVREALELCEPSVPA